MYNMEKFVYVLEDERCRVAGIFTQKELAHYFTKPHYRILTFECDKLSAPIEITVSNHEKVGMDE